MIGEKELIVIIENLLEEHDCIILPQFGGFVVQKEYYKFIPEQKIILPKKRWVAFNQKLQTDDGFLISEVSTQLNISNKKAQIIVEELIASFKNQIKQRETLSFGRIGSFFINENAKLQFTPNLDSNFDANMFGLQTVSIERGQTATTKVKLVEPPLEIADKIEEEAFIPMVAQEELTSKRVKNWVYAAIFFIVAGISTFVLTEPESQKYTSSLSPFPSISSKEYESSNEPIDAVENETQKEVKTPEKVVENNQEVLNEPKAEIENGVNTIELIAGSFLTNEKAQAGVEELKSKGIEEAYILEKKETQKYFRISIGSVSSMEEGYLKASTIKKEHKVDIWVFENK